MHWRNIAWLLPHFADGIEPQGDLTQVCAFADSLVLVRSLGTTHGFEASITVLFQGWLAIMAEDTDRAAERFEASLALSQGLGSMPIRSAALAGLAEVALSRGRIDEAAEHFREGLVLGWEAKIQLYMVFNLQGLVRVAIGRGEPALAARLAGALETCGNTLQAMPEAVIRKHEADVVHLRRMLGEDAFAAKRTKGRTLHPDEIVAEAVVFMEKCSLPWIAEMVGGLSRADHTGAEDSSPRCSTPWRTCG